MWNIHEIFSVNSLPWNQKTFPGWMGLNFISALAAGIFIVIAYAFLSFFVAIYNFQEAFYNHYKALIREMDEIEDANYLELSLQIVKLVRYHNVARG